MEFKKVLILEAFSTVYKNKEYGVSVTVMDGENVMGFEVLNVDNNKPVSKTSAIWEAIEKEFKPFFENLIKNRHKDVPNYVG